MVEISWKCALKNARWWAVEANGEAHWFWSPQRRRLHQFLVFHAGAGSRLWLLRGLAEEPRRTSLGCGTL